MLISLVSIGWIFCNQ